MKQFNFSRWSKLVIVALVLVCGLAFTGCKPDVQYRDVYVDLTGTWVEAGSWGNSYYEISYDTFKNYGDTYESYEGNSLVVREISNTAGYIYIKYTKAMNADYTYSTTAPDVGKWYAIYYSDLSSTSVKLAGAWGTKSSTDTLEEAIEEFTVENGYFSGYSTCAKQ